jgi:RNA polymerase sigma-70 factor (ECF subfamily)
MEVRFNEVFATLRPELTAYLSRLVVRPHIAEEIAQTAFMRFIESGSNAPDGRESARAWLFRVATNLAIDELRRHSTWRESVLLDLRESAESNPAIVAQSNALVGTPETKMVAREHLVACFACTLRNLPERKAAAFLLKEVHDFSLMEIADILQATETQAKNWLQEARAFMRTRYDQTCALMTKKGVCYQCVELADYFLSGEGNPIAGSQDHLDARINIVRQLRSQPTGRWHSILLELLDDLC